jgi:hypothetical protein
LLRTVFWIWVHLALDPDAKPLFRISEPVKKRIKILNSEQT